MDFENCTIFTNQSETLELTGSMFFLASVTLVLLEMAVVAESSSILLFGHCSSMSKFLPMQRRFLNRDEPASDLGDSDITLSLSSVLDPLHDRSIGSSWQDSDVL